MAMASGLVTDRRSIEPEQPPCPPPGHERSSFRLASGAMVAVEQDPIGGTFDDRLITAGKPKVVAPIAVAQQRRTALDTIIRGQKP